MAGNYFEFNELRTLLLELLKETRETNRLLNIISKSLKKDTVDNLDIDEAVSKFKKDIEEGNIKIKRAPNYGKCYDETTGEYDKEHPTLDLGLVEALWDSIKDK